MSFRSQWIGLPGYSAAGRRMSKHTSSLAAFNSLDIFDGDTAQQFLEDPARSLAAKVRNEVASGVGNLPSRPEDYFIEMAMLFAIVAVEADRERRRDVEDRQAGKADQGHSDQG